MPPLTDTKKAEIGNTLDQIKTRATELQGRATPVKPITISDLQDTTSVASMTPQTPSTAATGMLGEIQSNTDQYTANLAKQSDRASQMEQSSFETYLKAQLDAPTQSELQSTEYKKEVDPLQKEVTSLNTQLTNEQQALTRRLQELDKNTQGLFGGALQDAKDAVERESLAKQADISVILTAKQAGLTDARAVADRAVTAVTDRNQKKVDVLGMLYLRNSGLFTTAEQRAFEAKQADRKAALDAETERLKSISDMSLDALANGASTSVVTAMRQAKTVEDAIRIGGSYIGAYERSLKGLQIQNLQSQIAERNATTTDGKPLTATQYVALGYGDRLLQADLIIDDIGSQFTGVASAAGKFLPNILKSNERQKFEQAQRNFINAVLRRESGAAIAPSEFDSAAQQYFPQPGDTPEVLVQKDLNRALVTKNLLREAGQDTSAQDAILIDPLKVGVSPTEDNPLGI